MSNHLILCHHLLLFGKDYPSLNPRAKFHPKYTDKEKDFIFIYLSTTPKVGSQTSFVLRNHL